MASKTISVNLEAYHRLRAARRYDGESFSQVILRARWPERTVTGGEFLRAMRDAPPLYTEESLERVERIKASQTPVVDKWRER